MGPGDSGAEGEADRIGWRAAGAGAGGGRGQSSWGSGAEGEAEAGDTGRRLLAVPDAATISRHLEAAGRRGGAGCKDARHGETGRGAAAPNIAGTLYSRQAGVRPHRI